MARNRLGQILKESQVLSEFDIQQALNKQKETGGAIGQILLESGVISESDLTRALAQQNGMEFIDLSNAEVGPEVLDLVDKDIAETSQIMPVSYDGSTLVVAISDPTNINVLDDLRFSLPTMSRGSIRLDRPSTATSTSFS